jgi:acetyltransferase-like isoleucine patch superfamily enzyme
MIHKLADVQSKSIGENTDIWQFSVVLKGAEIGTNCNINCHVFIENDVEVGNNVTVKSGVQLWDGIRIKDNVFIGPNVTFTNDKQPRSKMYPEKFSSILVDEFASIGANATLLPNIKIGKYAMVGAGAVVTKTVLAHQVVVGNPAKPIGYVTEDNIKVSLDLIGENDCTYKYENESLIKLS